MGVTLDIPAGALSSPVAISVTPGGAVPGGFTALSRLYTFAPDGTTFLKPIGVTFDIDPGAESPVVYWSKPGGGYEAVGDTVTGGQIKAQKTTFTGGYEVTSSANPGTVP